ncbi:MAG: hypothetical protein WC781_02290 [Candidatus Pacearchaeota archaeon]|jgi:hypothetical protein
MAKVLAKTKVEDRIRQDEKRDRQRIIDGLFYEPFNDAITQFTGIFGYSKGEGYDAIEGLLEDYYGRSRIEGLLSEQKSLSFNKTYRGRPSIEYKFSFDKESGLYIGAWKGKDAFNGHSVCKLDNGLIQQDVDFILNYFKSFDAMTNEDRAKAIIGYMVGEGQLNVSRDSNGELMFSLSEEGKRLSEEANKKMTPEEKTEMNKFVDKAINQTMIEIEPVFDKDGKEIDGWSSNDIPF